MCNCFVCERIDLIKKGRNPFFVRELDTGYVVLGDYQRFKGYTLFLCKEHATELHYLDQGFRQKFLEEMSLTAEAVYKAFHPDKLNYELLGACNEFHMHCHIFPRRAGDMPEPGPVWKLDKSELNSDQYRLAEEELKVMKKILNGELDQLLSSTRANFPG